VLGCRCVTVAGDPCLLVAGLQRTPPPVNCGRSPPAPEAGGGHGLPLPSRLPGSGVMTDEWGVGERVSWDELHHNNAWIRWSWAAGKQPFLPEIAPSIAMLPFLPLILSAKFYHRLHFFSYLQSSPRLSCLFFLLCLCTLKIFGWCRCTVLE
jgi:hypothetical protein